MSAKQKLVIFLVVIAIAGIIGYFVFGDKEARKPIELNGKNQSLPGTSSGPANTGPVGAISGVSCENWNRRPVAVMQPVDAQARPVAGFSQADMVFEMPNPAAGIFVTRLMGVYQCGNPEEVGSIRSARHDYISVAKGLDAIFVGWGGSAFALKKLDDGVIDNLDCNDQGGHSASKYCFRKERTGLMRIEDTGYIKFAKIWEAAKDFGYRTESKFAGYPHQEDKPFDQRPNGGHLRIGYPGIMEAEYDYDRDSNSYKRTWGGVPDTDRTNKERIAPKNIVVVIAENEQILAEVDYKGRGVEDPWAGLEEWEKVGPRNISGRYNNLQFGDPWFDTKDSGSAYFYMNGEQKQGMWRKDKSNVESKLAFFDEGGNEIKFVPGQIWVEVMVPGQKFEWTPAQ
jgi:hypothetical protein